MFYSRTTCRACRSKELHEIIDLGETPFANNFLNINDVRKPEPTAPLHLDLCTSCSFIQIREVVDPEILYSNYAYITSTSKTMNLHMLDISEHLLTQIDPDHPPKVMEIASNTGSFLQKFKDNNCQILGIEPAANISDIANKNGIPTQTVFFNAHAATAIHDHWGQADLIIGRHVFAHIDDLSDVFDGLDKLTHKDSLIAFEVPYAVDFFEKTEFDTIYHEHLSYITVHGLQVLLKNTPFTLVRVDRYPIHGGSILFHVKRTDSQPAIHASVEQLMGLERKLKINKIETWQTFANTVTTIQTQLYSLIQQLKSDGKRIIGYGASAKGNTLLNTSGIDHTMLDYIVDNTPFKQGKSTPGSNIPIVSPERLIEDKPDFALLLAWNFAPEIMDKERQYIQQGGKFIHPIPYPHIIDEKEA